MSLFAKRSPSLSPLSNPSASQKPKSPQWGKAGLLASITALGTSAVMPQTRLNANTLAVPVTPNTSLKFNAKSLLAQQAPTKDLFIQHCENNAPTLEAYRQGLISNNLPGGLAKSVRDYDIDNCARVLRQEWENRNSAPDQPPFSLPDENTGGGILPVKLPTKKHGTLKITA